MPKRRKSTALRADGAFVNLVRMTRRKGLPEWASAGACRGAMYAIGQGPNAQGWHQAMTSRESDRLVGDYQIVEDALGDIPWRWAGRVPE